MNDEYISREAVVRYLKGYSEKECNSNSPYGMITSSVLNKVERALSEMPAADVQPVNQWISVKDRLPENNRPVLCFVIDTTSKCGTYVIGSCEHSEFFLKIGDNKRFSFQNMQLKATRWKPLPEPPKDGDTECQ